jgi:hypothetical protein
MVRWIGWSCVVWCVACGPSASAGSDSDESSGAQLPPDPRIESVEASYLFDSGCAAYEATNVTVEVHAIDAPIESVELRSYSVAGYMSGADVRLGAWGGSEVLPLAVGESAQLRFHDEEDGWAGECADFTPPAEDVALEAVVVIDGETIELTGSASIGCGWSEC